MSSHRVQTHHEQRATVRAFAGEARRPQRIMGSGSDSRFPEEGLSDEHSEPVAARQ